MSPPETWLAAAGETPLPTCPEATSPSARPEARLAGWQAFIDRERERLRQAYAAQPTGAELARAQTALFDGLIRHLYQVALAEVRASDWADGTEALLAVAAVGGYGRAQLSPFSDIDVVFIPAREGLPFVDALVRETYRLLVETLRPPRYPRVSHSYRPFTDLALLDHQTLTALLEARYLCGDEALFQRFMQELLRQINPVVFCQVNRREREAVWTARPHSLYQVEPDLKDGPGGLRDFQAAIWMAKIAYQIPDWDVLAALRQRGVVDEEQGAAVVAAVEYLLRVRHGLHFIRGRKLDTLHVHYQDELAQTLGYRSAPGGPSAVESLMADYYRHTRALADFSRRLIRQCGELRLPLGDGFWVEASQLRPMSEAIFQENPARLIRVFEYAQRYDLELSLELEELIRHSLEGIDDSLRHHSEAAASFLALLHSSGDVAGALRRMLDLGVLECYLPEFGRTLHLLPFDQAHEHTIGEHSLRVVEGLQRLRGAVTPAESPLGEAVALLSEPELLYLAALLHDAGKAERKGNHALTGSRLARQVADRLGLSPDRRDRVVFLVEHHLLMSHTARLHSLALPETIEHFTAAIPSEDLLHALYALTYADIEAVGEGMLRDTEARLLEELYVKARREWEARSEPATAEQRVAARVSQMRRRVTRELSDWPADKVEEHLGAMPAWYVLNNSSTAIARHLEYLERLPEEQVVTDFTHERGSHYTEMTVCTADRPGLFRDIAGVLTANNTDVYLVHLDVRLGPHPICLSTWWIDDYGQPVSPVRRERLAQDLASVLREGESVAALMARRGKTVGDEVVLQDLNLSNDLSRQHTVVHLRARDQIGLLYLLTAALTAEGLNIRTAKVTTWRGLAEDAFYVTDRAGRKLPDESCEAVAQRLRERLVGRK